MLDRKNLKEFIDIAQATVNIIAVIVAATWAYMLFIQQREITTKLKIDLNIIYRDVAEDKTWLRSEVILENVGKTILRARKIEARLQLVEPLDNIIVQKLKAGEQYCRSRI